MRMGVLKTLVAGASALALTFAVAGSASAADKPLYGALMKTLANPFWGAMEKGVDAGAQEIGVDLFVQAVESDQAAEPQLNTCNTMLEKKPAVMITAAISSTNLLPCLKRANELKIPVVDLDGNLDPEITKKAGVDVAFHIGSDNQAAGGKAADYLASVLGKDAKGSVLVIEGLSGNITGAKRAHGFADELKNGGARARPSSPRCPATGTASKPPTSPTTRCSATPTSRRSSAPMTTWRSAQSKRRARPARTS